MRAVQTTNERKIPPLHMLECDTEIGPSVFMNLLERNQWGKRYIKDEAEFDLCTEGEGKCSAEPGPEEMAI